MSRYSIFMLMIRSITTLLIVLYPLAIWFGLPYFGIQILAPVLLLIFILRLLVLRPNLGKQHRLAQWLALLGILLALVSWSLQRQHWLLYYPVAVNLLLLLFFAYSLRGPQTAIEQFARLSDPNLSQAGVRYTRRVTQIWCVFFVFNGSLALATCLSGDMALWAAYNGGISYLLMGMLLGGEWLVRKHMLRL